ncbi:MAG: hypothetical protein ACJ0RL_04995 [Porticoccaceae bacterium]
MDNVLRSKLKEMDARAFIGLYYQEEGIDSIPSYDSGRHSYP